MSRMLTILIAMLVLIGSFLVIRYAKDSYKLLPFDEKNPLNSPADFQNWKEFNQSEEGFKILFPVYPQHVSDKIVDPITKELKKYDMYAAANDSGTGFIISKITFPAEINERDVDAVLRNAVNDVLQRSKENKLKKTEAGQFHGLHSLDFALENKEVTVAGKAILNHNVLYVLSMADKTQKFDVNTLNFFVNSFDILDIGAQSMPTQQNPSKKSELLKAKDHKTSLKE